MKATSIVGIVVSALSLICVIAFEDSDPIASSGWGIIASIFLLAFSIVVLCNLPKKDR
jgi:hypothetical protein